MNQIKTGNFIAMLRKQEGLTQAELGEKIGVTSKAVSKWERGICIPDVTKLNMVADTLNISVVELLNGEYNQIQNKSSINEITKNSIKYYSDLFSKNKIKKVIIISVIITFIIVFAWLMLFGINNYGKVFVYNISSTSDDYVGNGNIIKTNEGNILTLTNISILDEDILTKKGYAFEFSIFINDNLIERSGDVSIYEHDNNDELLLLGDYVKTISIYVMDDLNQIVIDSSVLNEKKIKLIITFIDDGLDMENYEMIFFFNKSFSNNKIIYEKNNI